jgi:hypothetical protein
MKSKFNKLYESIMERKTGNIEDLADRLEKFIKKHKRAFSDVQKAYVTLGDLYNYDDYDEALSYVSTELEFLIKDPKVKDKLWDIE